MTIELEILTGSYWEHFKKAKDLALIYEVGHPKRVEIENEVKVLAENIKISKQNIKIS